MTIEGWIYLAPMFDLLKQISQLYCLLFFLAIVFIGVILGMMRSAIGIYGTDYKDFLSYVKTATYFGKKGLSIFIVSLIVTILTPSEKTIYLMLGAHYLKSSTIPSKVELLINKKLDTYLSEDKE